MKKQFVACFVLPFLMVSTANSVPVLKPVNGADIPFASLQGKWVIVNYWASWCQPCLNEIPELNKFYEQHKHQNIALFAVNYDALPLDKQQELTKQYEIHYPLLAQDPAKSLGLGDIRGVPVTFVFDAQGNLEQTLYGEQTASSLSKIINL